MQVFADPTPPSRSCVPANPLPPSLAAHGADRRPCPSSPSGRTAPVHLRHFRFGCERIRGDGMHRPRACHGMESRGGFDGRPSRHAEHRHVTLLSSSHRGFWIPSPFGMARLRSVKRLRLHRGDRECAGRRSTRRLEQCGRLSSFLGGFARINYGLRCADL
jgi:hypothetical protein